MVLGDNGRHHSISVGDGSLLVNHTVKNEVLHRCPTGSPLAAILKHLNKGKILICKKKLFKAGLFLIIAPRLEMPDSIAS